MRPGVPPPGGGLSWVQLAVMNFARASFLPRDGTQRRWTDLGRWADQTQIDERVRAAHLEHFCPGGVGVPVTSSRPVGLGLEEAAATTVDGNAARPVGQGCGRCEQHIAPGQDARRRVSGMWVHESCPART